MENVQNYHAVVWGPEPEFLKILKCDLAESAITGFQFNCLIFLMIKHLIIGIWTTFFRFVKFTEKNLFFHKQKL
jgi:hypothetical protein